MGEAGTVLYTQAACTESRKVRAWLAARKVPIIERNVTDDPDAAQALLDTGIFATPLLVHGHERVIGYRPERLAAALNLQGNSE